MPRRCVGNSTPRRWRPSSWVPSPRRCTWSPPSGPHCRCNNVGAMRPPESADGPPPSGRCFIVVTALLRRWFSPRRWRLSWWAPSPSWCAWSPPSGSHCCCRTFGADDAAGLRGWHSLLRERFFTALLRGEFSVSLLVHFFVGAISSPPIREPAVLCLSSPYFRG